MSAPAHPETVPPARVRWPSPYVLLAIPIFLGFLLSYCLKPRSEWESVYLGASRRLVDGGDLFRFRDGYGYPPFMALAMTPFLALPWLMQRIAWWAINVTCLTLVCRWAWQLAGGNEPPGWRSRLWPDHALCLLGMLTGILHAFNCLSNHQTDLIMAALMLAGCLALRNGRDLQAAVWLGLAAAMKCTPLLWTVYLAWTRRWRAAALLIAVALGVNLLPDLVSKPAASSSWLATWYEQYLAPMPRALQLGLLVSACVLLLSCALLWRRPRADDEDAPAAPLPEGLEFSIVFMLMLLLSPMSSKAHFSTLLVPGFCLARAAWELHSRALLAWLILANVVGALALNWLGRVMSGLGLYYGAYTMKTLLLLAGCCVALLLLRRKAPIVAEAPVSDARALVLAAA
jgi:hypothetical protein